MLFDISVSAASGIEAVTKRELNKLGIEDAPAKNGRISFRGDEKTVALCNLYLRTANRVYITVANFHAVTFDELYDGVYSVEWQDYLPADAKIIVSAKCNSSALMAYSSCQSVAKKAICQKTCLKYGVFPSETGSRYKIEVSVLKNVITVSLDTSGEGLHRRGYRGLVGDAPLKETVAAALVELSVWNPERPLVDLFCGSGTIPIEAALIATNTPPGIHRDFDFLHWQNFDFSFYEEIKEKAYAEIHREKDLYVSGFDIDEKQISLARKHAELAGVADIIYFQRADMRDFSNKRKRGVIISNPPYGERLMTRKQIVSLYEDLSSVYSRLEDWCIYILTSVEDFERIFGKKADKTRKLYNGKLECRYYTYLADKK